MATAVTLAFPMQPLPEYEIELSPNEEAYLRPVEDMLTERAKHRLSLAMLLTHWRLLVDDLEQESAKRYWVGEEVLNFLGSREIIERDIWQPAPSTLKLKIDQRILALDARYRASTAPVTKPLMRHGTGWWWYRCPTDWKWYARFAER